MLGCEFAEHELDMIRKAYWLHDSAMLPMFRLARCENERLHLRQFILFAGKDTNHDLVSGKESHHYYTKWFYLWATLQFKLHQDIVMASSSLSEWSREWTAPSIVKLQVCLVFIR